MLKYNVFITTLLHFSRKISFHFCIFHDFPSFIPTILDLIFLGPPKAQKRNVGPPKKMLAQIGGPPKIGGPVRPHT
jgi:hypothetical protein